ASCQEQSVIARRPFAVVARKEVRCLFLLDAERRAGVWLMIILPWVAGFVVRINRLEQQAVLRGELLLQLGRRVELLNVGVWCVAGQIAVEHVQRKSGTPLGSVERAILRPVAATLVFR